MLTVILLWVGAVDSGYGMGLRSLVALPVETGGAVMRMTVGHGNDVDTSILSASLAYGVSSNQTLLLGVPYRISPAGNKRQGDVSALYRYITWKDDRSSGTDRLGLLGGAIVPTENDRDGAMQAGFVSTHFQGRHEIDADVLYQLGLGNRNDSGRYNISWQYRHLPADRPDWGLASEIYSVLELNGRWLEDASITHQVTFGLQWIHQKMVVEGGGIRNINGENNIRYLLSIRFHI